MIIDLFFQDSFDVRLNTVPRGVDVGTNSTRMDVLTLLSYGNFAGPLRFSVELEIKSQVGNVISFAPRSAVYEAE